MLIMVNIHLIMGGSKSDFHFTAKNFTHMERRRNTDKEGSIMNWEVRHIQLKYQLYYILSTKYMWGK